MNLRSKYFALFFVFQLGFSQTSQAQTFKAGSLFHQASKKSGCQLFQKCRGENNPAWGKLVLGADLAELLVQKHLEVYPKDQWSRYAATVSVVDSGFDYKNQYHSLKALSIKLRKGHPDSGSSLIDPDGHGTAVSGVVSGKGLGITHLVNLRIYRATPPHANGSITNEMLSYSIINACKRSDIVNVSWGSIADEMGMIDIEKESWYAEAKRLGCLVVKASGNSGVKIELDPKENISGPFLSVASSNQFDQDSAFSSSGMIAGPGEGVYSLLSHQHEYSSFTIGQGCVFHGAKIGPVNGTSFAAPAVAGVAGQIVTILRARRMLPKTAETKLRLIKAILQASVVSSGLENSSSSIINSLIAAQIASRLNSQNFTTRVSKLRQIWKSSSSKICGDPLAACERKNQCGFDKACSNKLREKAALCPEIPDTQLNWLIELFYQSNESELSNYLLTRFHNTSSLTDRFRRSLRDVWEKNLKSGYKSELIVISLEKAINLIHLARLKGFFDFITYERLRQVIASSSFSFVFRINDLIGENIWNGNHESYYPKLVDSIRVMPFEEVSELIKNLGHIRPYYPEGELGLIYLLNLQRDSLPSLVLSKLRERNKELATDWLTGRLFSGQSAFSMTQNAPVYNMLINFLPNGRSKVLKQIDLGLSRQSLHLFSFAIYSKTFLGPKTKTRLAKMLLQDHVENSRVEYIYLLNQAANVLINASDPIQYKKTLTRFFLNSPLAKLPLSSVTTMTYDAPSSVLLYARDISFWSQLVQKDLSNIIRILLGKRKVGHIEKIVSTTNIEMALTENGFLRGKRKSELYQRVRPLLEKTLIESVELLKKALELRETIPVEVAFNFVKVLVEKGPSFERTSFYKPMKKVLRELSYDVSKNPHKYPQSFQTELYRLLEVQE